MAHRLTDLVAALFGLSVGSLCPIPALLSLTFVKVILLGTAALMLANLAVILAIKLRNLVSREKLNPLAGTAALGPVPDAAHMAQVYGRREDPHFNVFPHALTSGQAALLISSLTAGLLWGILGAG